MPALALTSLTSKDDQNAAYKRLETDLEVRLVYGRISCRSCICDMQLARMHKQPPSFTPMDDGGSRYIQARSFLAQNCWKV